MARIKIRGIYTTALTRVLLNAGHGIAQPSPEIQERFGLKPDSHTPEVLIRNREDLQGIEVIGEADRVGPLIRFLQPSLIDAVLLEFRTGVESEDDLEEGREVGLARLEFGGAAKKVLDEIRSSVVPTLARHHRLRIIHPQRVERAEKELLRNPAEKERLEREIFLELIALPLRQCGTVKIEHIKVSGKPIRPRQGHLVKAEDRKILVKRFFSQGRYDGLDLPIEEGDYGLTEIQEGAWHIKHAYYSRLGSLKGQYYNINTPVEFYPEGVRYLDLEVDVVRPVAAPPFLIDGEALALLARRGLIGAELEKRAMEEAENLKKKVAS